MATTSFTTSRSPSGEDCTETKQAERQVNRQGHNCTSMYKHGRLRNMHYKRGQNEHGEFIQNYVTIFLDQLATNNIRSLVIDTAHTHTHTHTRLMWERNAIILEPN